MVVIRVSKGLVIFDLPSWCGCPMIDVLDNPLASVESLTSLKFSVASPAACFSKTSFPPGNSLKNLVKSHLVVQDQPGALAVVVLLELFQVMTEGSALSEGGELQALQTPTQPRVRVAGAQCLSMSHGPYILRIWSSTWGRATKCNRR